MLSRISRSATGLFSSSPSGRINEYKISEKPPVVDIVAPPETTTIPEEPSPTVAVHSLEEELVTEPTIVPAPEPIANPVPATEPEAQVAREATPALIEPVPTPSPSFMQVAPEKSEKLAPVDPAPHDVTPYSDAKHIPYPPLEDSRPESPSNESSAPTNPSAVSTFAAGAATTTGQKTVDASLHRRAATAENVLTNEEKAKIEKTEGTLLLQASI